MLIFWRRQGPSVHHWMVSLMSIAISLLVFFGLYGTPPAWRNRRWASQVYNAPRPQIIMMIAATFIGGIAMAIASFVLYKTSRPPVEFWQQLIFGAAYAPIYVLFTAAFTLGAIQAHLSHLNKRVPLPLFVDTERLLRVTIKTALQSLNIPDKSDNYKILEVNRIPETGGIKVRLLLPERQAYQPKRHSQAGKQQGGKRCNIEADRWGRVKLVQTKKQETE